MSDKTGQSVRKNWRIFEGYVHRREVYAGEGKSEALSQNKLPLTQYVDTDRSSKRYQKRVYRYASKIHREGRILDIGCGTAYKTLKYFRKAETLGLEIEPTLSMLRERFPDRCWEESNFTKIPKGRFSMIVCASESSDHCTCLEIAKSLSSVRKLAFW